MRYPSSEKLEIIRLVEQSRLPVRRALQQIGIPRSTFYRWCDLYRTGGPEALDDCSPRPDRVWNRIPEDVRARIVTLALDQPELSPRELAVRFTDTERYFVSEASVYRLLKAHDLITSPGAAGGAVVTAPVLVSPRFPAVSVRSPNLQRRTPMISTAARMPKIPTMQRQDKQRVLRDHTLIGF
jgi:transposase-like protein